MLSKNTPRSKFDYIFNKASSLLILRNLGEVRRPLERLHHALPDPLQLAQPIRTMVDQLTDTIDYSLCEVIITTSVTALEVYLEQTYLMLTGKEWGRPKLENVSALRGWSSE